jgi:hypothetical protein
MNRLTDEDRMMKPRFNINGQTREEHVRVRTEAMTGLRATMEKVQELRPHMRDYIGNPDAYQRDLAIYTERFAGLDRLYNSIYDEVIAIQEGGR